MTEQLTRVELETNSELMRIDTLAREIIDEFSEEDGGVHYDEYAARWTSPDEAIQMKLEAVFSYTSVESWVEYHLRTMPGKTDEHPKGALKTLVVFKDKNVDGKPLVAEIRERSELRWGNSDWEGWGEFDRRMPTEYDIAEFDIYLTMMQQDKQRQPRFMKRQAAKRELGAWATRESSLETDERDFFMADFR